MVAETPQDFRDRAANCERLAETAMLLEEREVLLRFASRWRARAEKDEARLKPSKPEADSAISSSRSLIRKRWSRSTSDPQAARPGRAEPGVPSL
jgi:hypothetical protein